jgi:hypothetical protein
MVHQAHHLSLSGQFVPVCGSPIQAAVVWYIDKTTSLVR